VAVEEAVTNVQQHAYDAEENSTYDLICELLPAALRIIIRERGIPFDPDRIPAYKGVHDLNVASTAGMGVFFMRSLMDECSFHNLGPEGKETRLVKYLSSQARAEQSVVEAHAIEAGPALIKEKIQYYVRPMREMKPSKFRRVPSSRMDTASLTTTSTTPNASLTWSAAEI